MTEKELSFVHRFIPAEDPRLPIALLLLHGTGGNENDLLALGRLLAPRASILSPRGKVLENGMPRFFRRLAEGVFDLEDLKARTHELADFVTAAAGIYGIDRKRIVAAGYSNGANMAASILLLRPGLLAGALLFHPMVPFQPEPMPDLSDTRVLVAAGRRDPLVPAEQAEKLAELLARAGAQVTEFWHDGDHSLRQEEVQAGKEWLATF